MVSALHNVLCCVLCCAVLLGRTYKVYTNCTNVAFCERVVLVHKYAEQASGTSSSANNHNIRVEEVRQGDKGTKKTTLPLLNALQTVVRGRTCRLLSRQSALA